MNYKVMFAPKKILNSEYFPLYVLIVISIISHFPFVIKGFGEPDAADLAVSIIDYINNGKNGLLTNFYFTDIVPLYVIYIKYFMKLIGINNIYIIRVMNYTNAVVGTLIVIPAYLLVKQLFNNAPVAFSTVLAFILAPSIYRSSIYGFPHLLALFFFITSAYSFLLWLDDKKYSWLILSFITFASSISFKSDFVLGSGVYFGFLYIRKIKEKEKIVFSFLIIILSFLFLLLLRHWIGINKGYTSSTFEFAGFIKNHLHRSFPLGELLRTRVAPVFYATGIVSFLMATIAIIFYIAKKRFNILVFVLAWTALPILFWMPLIGYQAPRHYILLVLPSITIVFLFLYEKVPRAMAFFTIIIILGNYLIPYMDVGSGRFDNNLMKSDILIDSMGKKLQQVASEIANIEGDKIIITFPAFKGYIFYEILSLVPNYEFTKINTYNSCYMLEIKKSKCILCIYYISENNIKDIITKYHLEKSTIILPGLLELNLSELLEKGLKIYRYSRPYDT